MKMRVEIYCQSQKSQIQALDRMVKISSLNKTLVLAKHMQQFITLYAFPVPEVNAFYKQF